MKIRFLNSFRRWKKGDVLEVERGVADLWVRRRRVAELVEGESFNPVVHTLVPAVPGLKPLADAVTAAVGRRRKSA